MKTRTGVLWLVLARSQPGHAYGHGDVIANARVVRTSRDVPRLQVGQVAVRVTVTVDDAAFEPMFRAAPVVPEPQHVLRAVKVEASKP